MTRLCIGGGVLVVAIAVSVFVLNGAETEKSDTKDKSPIKYSSGFKIQVSTGTEAAALAYYKNVVTAELGFPTNPVPMLDDLLAFYGYSLTGEGLEKDSPESIMKAFPGEVLVSQFFAPKITDVSGRSTNTGWRKIVRLQARSMSPAEKVGLKSMFLLFNIFEDGKGKSPFTNAAGDVIHSVNNQVILTRTPGSKLKMPLYFMTFGAYDSKIVAERGFLITFLDATFDAGDPALASSGGLNRYYVPIACAACHGGLGKPKLNYLDTDHWFDRIAPGDDFEKVKVPLLFDAGTNDPSDARFKQAFDIVRKINTEIRDQNKDADGSIISFQQVAAESWLKNHAASDQHVSLFDRSLTFSGNATWSSTDPVDSKLLPLLNRYCFRCHTSIEYHIYDKSAVVGKAGEMIDRINENPNGFRQYFMPQDREMKDPDRTSILQLLLDVRE